MPVPQNLAPKVTPVSPRLHLTRWPSSSSEALNAPVVQKGQRFLSARR